MPSKFVARGVEAYDRYMGRWSRRLAPLFIDFAGLAAGDQVLDVGCGTGSLAFAIAARGKADRIEAIDYEPHFVDAVRARSTDARITVRQADACNLPFASGEFDRALSMLVFHFVSDPLRAAGEMKRVVRAGGVAAATTWDIYGGMPTVRMFWDTAAAVVPAADERRAATLLRPITRPGELSDLFTKAGFVDVAEMPLVIRMEFSDFEDYWDPMMNGQGSHAEFFASLPSDTRDRIKSAVRAAYLCATADGPRSFASLAWAVRGVVPG